MIKILIVDDHDLVREGIQRLLEDVSDMSVVGSAGSGEKALEQAAKLKPDVILMDLKMPGIGGMEATTRLVHNFPKLKILIVTSCVEEPFPTRILQAGALGYFTKGSGKEEMVKAVRMVASNQRYISPVVAQNIALKKFDSTDQNPFSVLSERELQVTIMITSGVKVTDISKQLYLSSKTINSYRYRIFEKLNIASDVELTLMAMRYGLIDSDKNF